MATETLTTPARADEASCFYIPSPISSIFSRLLAAFAEMIERERDIAEVDCWDPAFRGWPTAAERSRDTVIDLKRDLFDTKVARPADKPLKLAAWLLHLAMLSEDEAEIVRLRRIARRKAGYFMLADDGATHRRVNGMVATALDLFEAFVALEGEPHVLDFSPDLALTA